eukprot:365733-Chlamydomonas_euryale.AAC.26
MGVGMGVGMGMGGHGQACCGHDGSEDEATRRSRSWDTHNFAQMQMSVHISGSLLGLLQM